ncbi:FAD-dependent oxidoreductase [uncultured Flavobacterium sp.]|uniref:NAD(P)/FAD-dependent oxidoreductase n=1 Tax=uncultured Flavobacterium sp. TaxID=165435 RepID=UPI0030ECB381|tara:strand:- start:45616 stop:46671 length:1056 start_codon:yes stop_codon:yes gene_type:complete
MIDFIIVGNGLAGICFAEIAIQNNKSVYVFDDNSQPSSKIAGGLYNPVVLKRFSEVWKAKEQLEIAFPFYKSIEEKLSFTFDYKIPIYRRLASVEEQNNWFQAADKPNLSGFLSSNLITEKLTNIESSFGFGEVLETGYLDIATLIKNYSDYLLSLNLYSSERFEYDKIKIEEGYIEYKNSKAKHIIFAEGFGLHSNPFFNNLPLDGTKGELLIIKALNLQLDLVVKSNIFILPIGNDLYKVGATYDWKDKTNNPTEEGKKELVENLKDLITCDFEIIKHFAGVRPTVKDRRPLVGSHHKYKNVHVLNGLGTRGVMLAPYLSTQLFKNIEGNIPLENEINIQRIYKKMNII